MTVPLTSGKDHQLIVIEIIIITIDTTGWATWSTGNCASPTSSCCAISTDLSDPLPPSLSIVHRSWDVFKAKSCIGTELLYVGPSWTSCLCSSMWRGPLEYVTYEFISTSLAVSRMSGLSNLDSFHDGWKVAVQLLLCGVLPPGLVQYCSQHSCVVAVKLFLHKFS